MRGQIRQRTRTGHYPSTSLADARKEAKKLLTEAPTRHAAVSFATACEEYKLSVVGLRPKTQDEYKRFLDTYFISRIGRKSLTELQYEHITACRTRPQAKPPMHWRFAGPSFAGASDHHDGTYRTRPWRECR